MRSVPVVVLFVHIIAFQQRAQSFLRIESLNSIANCDLLDCVVHIRTHRRPQADGRLFFQFNLFFQLIQRILSVQRLQLPIPFKRETISQRQSTKAIAYTGLQFDATCLEFVRVFLLTENGSHPL